MLTAPFTENRLGRALRPAAEPLVSKLGALAPLSQADAALLRSLSVSREQHQGGVEIPDAPTRARVVLSGWACRMRMLPDGRRQIFSFLLPGDTIGVWGRSRPAPGCAFVTLTRVETADAGALRDVLAADPTGRTGLGLACLRAAALEEAQLLDHVTRLGRQTALERTAHLLLELRWRLTAAGLSDGSLFPMPLTQETLADALGLSIVHINRTLQQLRREGMIHMRSGRVDLPDVSALSARADYSTPALNDLADHRAKPIAHAARGA